MAKPGFIIPPGTEIRPWPGASFEAGDEAALSAALSEAQILAYIAEGHLEPTLAPGPAVLWPRILYVSPNPPPGADNVYATWDQAHLAALALSPTEALPVAVRFLATVMPVDLNVAALKEEHILVSDALGGSGSGRGVLVLWVQVSTAAIFWEGAITTTPGYALTYDPDGEGGVRFTLAPPLDDGYMATGVATFSVNGPFSGISMADGMPVAGVIPWGVRVAGGHIFVGVVEPDWAALSASLGGATDGAIMLALPL